ncbi:MAG: S8 family serine peptidase [Bacteroidota bacterium]
MRLKLVLLLFIISSAEAQQKYWIQHSDCIEIKVHFEGLTPDYSSAWIAACSYSLSATQARTLNNLGITLSPVKTFSYLRNERPPKNGFGIDQIYGVLLRARGLKGKGVKIGVIDGGFANILDDPSLNHLSENGQIKAYRDYFSNSTDPGTGRDTHGTEVTQLIAGYNNKTNILHGLATDATFYLAKTDFDGFERRIEEDNLIAAMEWMHQEGVQIINISLGYTKGYNDKSENYSPEQMDGKTSAVVRAVEHASVEEGMLIVVAAGNEANNIGWKTLSTLADAQHALTVGSTQLPVWDKAYFSSIGPEFIDYIKPDVVVFSGVGTSFSAPIITGLAACIKEYDPGLTNLEIISIIQKAGHLYPFPNNYLGYGVPLCENILKILDRKESNIKRPEIVRSNGNQIKLNITVETNRLILLHKNADQFVIKRNVLKPRKSNIRIKRYQGASQTTMIYDQSAKEIIWE